MQSPLLLPSKVPLELCVHHYLHCLEMCCSQSPPGNAFSGPAGRHSHLQRWLWGRKTVSDHVRAVLRSGVSASATVQGGLRTGAHRPPSRCAAGSECVQAARMSERPPPTVCVSPSDHVRVDLRVTARWPPSRCAQLQMWESGLRLGARRAPSRCASVPHPVRQSSPREKSTLPGMNLANTHRAPPSTKQQTDTAP